MRTWMLLIRHGWFGRVKQFLDHLGVTEMQRMDEYLICQGPDDLPEAVRNCQSVLTIAPVEAPPDGPAGGPAALQRPATRPVGLGSLVTVQVAPGGSLTGRVHSVNGETAVVHVWCFGRAVPMTVRLDVLAPVDLPEVWR